MWCAAGADEFIILSYLHLKRLQVTLSGWTQAWKQTAFTSGATWVAEYTDLARAPGGACKQEGEGRAGGWCMTLNTSWVGKYEVSASNASLLFCFGPFIYVTTAYWQPSDRKTLENGLQSFWSRNRLCKLGGQSAWECDVMAHIAHMLLELESLEIIVRQGGLQTSMPY